MGKTISSVAKDLLMSTKFIQRLTTNMTEEEESQEKLVVPEGCWFCIHCGHINKDENYYCEKCGRMPWYDVNEATHERI